MWRFVYALALTGILAAPLACQTPKGEPSPPVPPATAPSEPGAWDVQTVRTLSYDVATVRGGAQSATNIDLSFTGNGTVGVRVGSEDHGTLTMAPSGRISDNRHPYLDLLASAPPPDVLSRPGASYTRLFPSEAERSMNPNQAIVGTAITSTTAQSGAQAAITFEGEVGLVDNAGGRKLISAWTRDSVLPGVEGILAGIASKGTTYLSGKAAFDTEKGQLVALSAQMVAIPLRAMTAAELASSPNLQTISFKLRSQP